MLYYFDHLRIRGHGNLGDDLNTWLLPHVLDRAALISPTTTVLGIGTILNSDANAAINPAQRKLVYTSGCGYSGQLQHDDSWTFLAVRGEMSRRQLGLAETMPLGDGAILISEHLTRLDLARSPFGGQVVFMPHVDSAVFARTAWEKACADAGLAFVSPSDPKEHVLAALLDARLVITTAMHGAIIADALRTPWIAVVSPGLNEAKWHDWASALDVTLDAASLPIFEPVNENEILSRFYRRLRRERIVHSLRHLKTRQGQLSKGAKLRQVRIGLLEAADRLKQIIAEKT